MSFGRFEKLRPPFPNVLCLNASICESDRFPVLTELGSLYDPGPGPSTFLGLRWSLLLTLELNLVPNENMGV